MYKCELCDVVFENVGTKRTVDKLEFWDCCPKCGSEDFEEFESPCENCEETNNCHDCPDWKYYEEWLGD